MSVIKFKDNSIYGRYDIDNFVLSINNQMIKFTPSFTRRKKRLYIILSKKCNLKCSYCFQKNEQKNGIAYSYTQINDILKRTIPLFDEIVLFGGEPFLDENLIYINKILEEINEKKVISFTNGNLSLKAIDVIKYYHDIILGLIVTLDGPKKIHDRIRKNPKSSSFDNIIHFTNILLENNIKSVVQINISKENIFSIQELISYLYKTFGENINIQLNPVKYSLNSLSLYEGIENYIMLRNLFPRAKIDYNSRLLRNLFNLFSWNPLEKDRCGLQETAVYDFSTGKIYSCPQNACSIVGEIPINKTNVSPILNYAAIKKEIDIIAFSSQKCKLCTYSYLCPYCCPYEKSRISNCKNDIEKTVKLILNNFNSLFVLDSHTL